MFQTCIFSQVIHKKSVKTQNQNFICLFNRNVYKKTASYDTVPVEGTEEFAGDLGVF